MLSLSSIRTPTIRRVALAALALLLATAQPARAGDRMLAVSWDGVARRVLHELLEWQPATETPRDCPSQRFPAVPPQLCGERWTCLPTLCRFQIIDSWDSSGKPLTKPQHAQMLSGYGPDTTGVFRNSGAASMPEGYTVYERLKQSVGPQLKTVHVAGRKYVSMGVVSKATRNGALDVNARRGGPDNRTGVNTTQRVVPLIEEHASGPLFMFVHYKEADVTGHLWGADSDAYREAVVVIDHELGEVLAALESVGALSSTAVLVATDHGFTGRFHVSRETTNTATWIAALNLDLRTDRAAKLLDVTPTILDYFGVAPAHVTPPLEGESLLVRGPGATVTTTTLQPTTTTTQQPTTTIQETTTTVTQAVTTTMPAPPSGD